MIFIWDIIGFKLSVSVFGEILLVQSQIESEALEYFEILCKELLNKGDNPSWGWCVLFDAAFLNTQRLPWLTLSVQIGKDKEVKGQFFFVLLIFFFFQGREPNAYKGQNLVPMPLVSG